MPGAPWDPSRLEGLGRPGPGIVHSRRQTYEQALRVAAAEVPRLMLRIGHVDCLLVERGRVVGAVVDGARVEADLVVDASGRAGDRLSRDPSTPSAATAGWRTSTAPTASDPGAEPGPMNTLIGCFGEFRRLPVPGVPAGARPLLGGRCPADRRCRPQAAAAPGRLRGGLPGDPRPGGLDRPRAVASGVRRAGRRGAAQRLPPPADLPGLVAVGDAVATTTPTRGRGVAMACMQVTAMLGLLDAGPSR